MHRIFVLQNEQVRQQILALPSGGEFLFYWDRCVLIANGVYLSPFAYQFARGLVSSSIRLSAQLPEIFGKQWQDVNNLFTKLDDGYGLRLIGKGVKEAGSYLENLAKYKQLFKEGKITELFSELKKTTAFPKMGNTRVRNHTDLLAEYKAKYGQTATNYPYSSTNSVTDFELAETGYFVRVYDGNPNKIASKWVFRIEDLRQYKNADELMEKLALPTKPTRIAIVEVPEKSGLRKSIAGSQDWSNGLKQNGGGVQYELNNYPNEWFKDLISIEEFFK